MGLLTQQQRDRAVEAMREYLAAPTNPDGRPPLEVQRERDDNRVKVIEGELQRLIQEYLRSSVSVPDFKTQIDGINKRHSYWGFTGFKGQMFFNMLVNIAADEEECDR